ncbi:MAPEG family protein [Erythrobacter ani]|uniref:MAPEG family protein n=1 Tax=Erythrobacter ani TaxID=2827235 RepID=A0ABS6SQM7_9SPHN|nr:MAPEG family protein [Erythrobacter ani]MBV7267346.1 MAPEG family protein [Erythrobacter ani]
MLAQMLAPAAVLVLWTLIMLFWTAGTRFPALAKLQDKSGIGKPGGRGQDLEGVLPDRVNWKSHNYSHLVEQPTVFYPAVLILVLMGPTEIDVLLAWIYVGLRIIHSLWQALVNRIPVRILIFTAYTIVLTVLAIRAVLATVFADPSAVS